MASPTGAQVIAGALRDLGVKVLFGIVGIPVIEVAEEAINLGIRFIGFRNEQAASYAAGAYGYLTGRPGVCLVVGGPGVLHAMAGIGNSHANAFPLLLLAGSSETHLISKGAFQELDAISLLTPHTKLAIRPPSLKAVPEVIKSAYRTSWYGRPGTGFVDLPADIIQATLEDAGELQVVNVVPGAPKCGTEDTRIIEIAEMLKNAKAPLIVIGKGAAYSRAEEVIRELIDSSRIPFLPTPMGKGVVADSHPANTASARSTALKEADVVLILGARLNWILHFGDAPKWNPNAQFIQVDISADEIGKNRASASLSIIGDIETVVHQLLRALKSWSYNPSSFPYSTHLSVAKAKNAATATAKAAEYKHPMTYAIALTTIKNTLHTLSPPEAGRIVYISEGANTMDISRSIFPVSHPRLRLDAGTHATMGVGLGYAIAAHAAYNPPPSSSSSSPNKGSASLDPYPLSGPKKIIAIEGDSAFGFSAMEIETMARYGMDVLIFVINNGGVYYGDADTADEWLSLQRKTTQSPPSSSSSPTSVSAFDTTRGEGGGEGSRIRGLRSTSLGFEVRYEKIAQACGGMGVLVRTPGELETATRDGFTCGTVCVVNVLIEAGKERTLEFGWMGGAGKGKGKGKGKGGKVKAEAAKL